MEACLVSEVVSPMPLVRYSKFCYTVLELSAAKMSGDELNPSLFLCSQSIHCFDGYSDTLKLCQHTQHGLWPVYTADTHEKAWLLLVNENLLPVHLQIIAGDPKIPSADLQLAQQVISLKRITFIQNKWPIIFTCIFTMRPYCERLS